MYSRSLAPKSLKSTGIQQWGLGDLLPHGPAYTARATEPAGITARTKVKPYSIRSSHYYSWKTRDGHLVNTWNAEQLAITWYVTRKDGPKLLS